MVLHSRLRSRLQLITERTSATLSIAWSCCANLLSSSHWNFFRVLRKRKSSNRNKMIESCLTCESTLRRHQRKHTIKHTILFIWSSSWVFFKLQKMWNFLVALGDPNKNEREREKKIKINSLPISFTPKLMLAKTQTHARTHAHTHTPHTKLKY